MKEKNLMIFEVFLLLNKIKQFNGSKADIRADSKDIYQIDGEKLFTTASLL